jgi:hypothetical protein
MGRKRKLQVEKRNLGHPAGCVKPLLHDLRREDSGVKTAA